MVELEAADPEEVPVPLLLVARLGVSVLVPVPVPVEGVEPGVEVVTDSVLVVLKKIEQDNHTVSK